MGWGGLLDCKPARLANRRPPCGGSTRRPMTYLQKQAPLAGRRTRLEALARRQPDCRAHVAIKALDGSVSSSSLRAVAIPATGRPFGSSAPTCTSTLAWSQ